MVGDRSLNKGAFLGVEHNTCSGSRGSRRLFPAEETENWSSIELNCFVHLKRVTFIAIYAFTNVGLLVFIQHRTRFVWSTLFVIYRPYSRKTPGRQNDDLMTRSLKITY